MPAASLEDAIALRPLGARGVEGSGEEGEAVDLWFDLDPPRTPEPDRIHEVRDDPGDRGAWLFATRYEGRLRLTPRSGQGDGAPL